MIKLFSLNKSQNIL